MYSPSPSHSTAFDDLIDPERAKILDSADAFLEQLEREEQEKRQEKKQKRQQSRVSGNFPIAPIEPQRSDSPPTNPSTSNHSSKENIETPVQNTHIDQHYSIARSSKREFPGYGIGPLESHIYEKRMPSKKILQKADFLHVRCIRVHLHNTRFPATGAELILFRIHRH